MSEQENLPFLPSCRKRGRYSSGQYSALRSPHNRCNDNNFHGGRRESEEKNDSNDKKESSRPSIHKKYVFTAECKIPLSDACNTCKRKQRPKCPCDNLNKHFGRVPGYDIKELEDVKTDLNKVRSSLDYINIEEWKRHTSHTIETSKVVGLIRNLGHRKPHPNHRSPEMVTNAWCKMYEILSCFELIDLESLRKKNLSTIKTVHLCECPGAFICATNHYIQTDPSMVKFKNEMESKSKVQCNLNLWWKAVSLNPYFEGNDINAMIDDDIFYRYTFSNWLRGEDDSGNIKSCMNIEHFTRAVQSAPELTPDIPQKTKNDMYNLVDLVTADGSIDSQFDANQQESITASLHFAEFFCAVKLLTLGGSFVLKMFTLFEHHSLSILALMSIFFKTVLVVKPKMSRDGSGEVYVVGKSFNGLSSSLCIEMLRCVQIDICKNMDTAIFPREWISDDFFRQYTSCVNFFSEFQNTAIRKNLELFYEGHVKKGYDQMLENKRIELANEFIRSFQIRTIPMQCQLVKEPYLCGRNNHSTREGRRKRVGGIQSDRLNSKISFDNFQLERASRYKQAKANRDIHKRNILGIEIFCFIEEDKKSVNVNINKLSSPPVIDEQPKKMNIGMQIMMRMDYSEGKGLGKSGQGITEPIVLKSHQNKQGLRALSDMRLPSKPFSLDLLKHGNSILIYEDNLINNTSNLNMIREYAQHVLLLRKSTVMKSKTLSSQKIMPQTVCNEWITWGTPLHSYELKISRFIDETLLTELLRVRIEQESGTIQFPPFSCGDCWLVESGKPYIDCPIKECLKDNCKTLVLDEPIDDNDQTIPLTDDIHDPSSTLPLSSPLDQDSIHLPKSGSLELLFVLMHTMNLNHGLSGSFIDHSTEEMNKKEHYMARILKSKLTSVLEITQDMNFPLASLMRPIGVPIRIIFSDQKIILMRHHQLIDPVKKNNDPDELISSKIPGTGPIDFIRPFYWEEILQQKYNIETVLHLTLRNYSSDSLSNLIFINPIQANYQEIPIIPREYAESEIKNQLILLGMIIVGLTMLEEGGDLIVYFQSIVTRFSATLILLLTFHFHQVVAIRPECSSAWTGVRYLHFRHSKIKPKIIKSKGIKGENIPILSYLMWCWNETIQKLPNYSVMQLLPPLSFTDATFNTWIYDWNNRMGEEELHDLLIHLDTPRDNGIYDTVSRQKICEDFLKEHQIYGFFFPSEVTEEEEQLPLKSTKTESSFIQSNHILPSSSFNDDHGIMSPSHSVSSENTRNSRVNDIGIKNKYQSSFKLSNKKTKMTQKRYSNDTTIQDMLLPTVVDNHIHTNDSLQCKQESSVTHAFGTCSDDETKTEVITIMGLVSKQKPRKVMDPDIIELFTDICWNRSINDKHSDTINEEEIEESCIVWE